MGSLLPRLSIGLFVLFLVGIGDIVLYLTFDARSDMLRTLPGQRHEVVGKLPETVNNINVLPRADDTSQEARRVALLNDSVLTQRADVPGLTIRFLELRGRVWRGELTVSAQTPPGTHSVVVLPRENLRPPKSGEEPSRVRVLVFDSPAAMRASYTSLSERYLGLGPWWVVMAIVPFAVVLLYRTYRRVGEEDLALQAKGLGPIYKLSKDKEHWELLFGLGSRHGVREGELLGLFDERRRRVGSLTALSVGTESSRAHLPLDAEVSPFYLVGKVEDTAAQAEAGPS